DVTWLDDDSHVNSRPVHNIGTYKARLVSGGCIDTAQINIGHINVDEPVDIGQDQTFCNQPSVVLDATRDGATYLWNTNDTTPTITVSNSGYYEVSVTRCGSVTPSNRVYIQIQSRKIELFVPNAFTPNSTVNLNDTFTARGIIVPPYSYMMTIYNKW